MSFAHLHVHTEYSLLDGSNKIKEYVSSIAVNLKRAFPYRELPLHLLVSVKTGDSKSEIFLFTVDHKIDQSFCIFRLISNDLKLRNLSV